MNNNNLINKNMEELKYWLVTSKPDDFGACRKELVETTKVNSKEYYDAKPVNKKDVKVLEKYFYLVPYTEEKERDEDRRFYGEG